MDRTHINIISILLGAAGLFGALSGFNVPEVNMTFFDTNPFAVKRDTIESTMKWWFTVVALCGFFWRLLIEIFDPSNRYHELKHYISFSAVCFLAVVFGVCVLTEVCNRIARSQWEPEVIKLEREHFEQLKLLVEHDGKEEDRKAVKQQIGQIEKLFWDVESTGDLKQRIERLQVMFTKPHLP